MNQEEFINLAKQATKDGASAIFVMAGKPITYRRAEEFIEVGRVLAPIDAEETLASVYKLAYGDIDGILDRVKKNGYDMFSIGIPNVARLRVSTYKQRGSLSAAIKVVKFGLPDPKQMNIPDSIVNLGDLRSGLILVNGHVKSGKSTTLAAIVDHINSTRSSHIITVENMIEYLHPYKKGIVSQKEVGLDTETFDEAFNSALDELPDVLMLGEIDSMRTLSRALKVAESGRLVLGSMYTFGAVNTISQMIRWFPKEYQHSAMASIGIALKGVVSQMLIPGVSGNEILAYELFVSNSDTKRMLMNGNLSGISQSMRFTKETQNKNLDECLRELVENGKISQETYEITRSAYVFQ